MLGIRDFLGSFDTQIEIGIAELHEERQRSHRIDSATNMTEGKRQRAGNRCARTHFFEQSLQIQIGIAHADHGLPSNTPRMAK